VSIVPAGIRARRRKPAPIDRLSPRLSGILQELPVESTFGPPLNRPMELSGQAAVPTIRQPGVGRPVRPRVTFAEGRQRRAAESAPVDQHGNRRAWRGSRSGGWAIEPGVARIRGAQLSGVLAGPAEHVLRGFNRRRCAAHRFEENPPLTRFDGRRAGSDPRRAGRWHADTGLTRTHMGGVSSLSLAGFVFPADGLFAAGPAWSENGFLCLGAVALVVFLLASIRRHSTQCPRCREVNRPAAIYCAQCGQKLPES
jgi:hypothetical protein